MIFEDSGEKYVECKPSLLFCIWFVLGSFFIFSLFCHICLWTWLNCIIESNYSQRNKYFRTIRRTFVNFFRERDQKSNRGSHKKKSEEYICFLKIIRLFIYKCNYKITFSIWYSIYVLTYYQSWCKWDLKALIFKNRNKAAMESWIFS